MTHFRVLSFPSIYLSHTSSPFSYCSQLNELLCLSSSHSPFPFFTIKLWYNLINDTKKDLSGGLELPGSLAATQKHQTLTSLPHSLSHKWYHTAILLKCDVISQRCKNAYFPESLMKCNAELIKNSKKMIKLSFFSILKQIVEQHSCGNKWRHLVVLVTHCWCLHKCTQ